MRCRSLCTSICTPVCAAVLGIITLAGSALRADPPAQAAVQPAAAAAAQPAAQPAQVCDVYLTPFTALGSDNSLDWVGKAVEQNLLTDLARAKLHPLGSEKPIANASDAQAAAKAAGAKYLISGSYQVADQMVRFNGQVIDAATGNVLGGISTTGAVRDLFTMEDALSSQAVQQLGQLANANNKPAIAPGAAAPAPAAQPPIVVQIVPPAAAAPVVATKYQGSALEQYVSTNRNPSADYNQPPLDLSGGENFASTPGSNYNVDMGVYGGGYGGGYGFGYGLGLFYPLPPYSKYGYGTDGHTHYRDHDHEHGDTPSH